MKVFVTGVTGFIGGSVAAVLAKTGHDVRGLVRTDAKAEQLRALGITPVIGGLDDAALVAEEARAADAVINSADSDHRGVVETLIEALAGSNKPFLHTSGSSIVSDTAMGALSEKIYQEDALPAPTPDKVARVAIDSLVRDSASRGIRSVVLCPTMIYGHGLGVGRDSVQLPRLVNEARATGVVKHVGEGKNIWSNVHITDCVDLFLIALEKAPAGSFLFIENGEASYGDLAAAIARRLGLGAPVGVAIDEAKGIWGHEMAMYALGSNSRVRGKLGRELGWAPKYSSALEWIANEL